MSVHLLPDCPPARTLAAGGGWGHHVSFMGEVRDVDHARKVYGHLPRRPKVGDLLTSELESGKVGVFTFVEVDLCHDPTDMFFGWVAPVSYADEIRLPQNG